MVPSPQEPTTPSLLSSSPRRPHLDLGLLPARRWLVDGHLDGFFVIGHHDGTKRAVLRVHLRVIHRPETMELQVIQVPVGWPEGHIGSGTGSIPLFHLPEFVP